MIVIYTPYFYPSYIGGAERLAYYTAIGLKNINKKVCILTLGEELKKYVYDNLDVYVLPAMSESEEHTIKEIPNNVLSDLLNKLKPEIIHIVGLQGVNNIVDYANENKIKLGMAGMDYSFPCDNRTLIRGNTNICNGRISAEDCFSCSLENKSYKDKIFSKIGKLSPGIINYLLSKIGTFLLNRKFGTQFFYWEKFKNRENLRDLVKNNLNLYFAPTDFTINIVSSYFNLEKTKIFKLMYPLPEEFRKTSVKTSKNNELIVGYIGRIIPIKGLEVLLTALNEIDANLPIYYKFYYPNNSDFVEYREMIRNKFSEYDKVEFIECNVLTSDELIDIHKGLDVLVVPSIWQEYLGFVTIEALSCETKVILSDFKSQRQFINNVNNGKLFSPGDSIRLGEIILEYYNEKITNGFKNPSFTIPSVEEYSNKLFDAYCEL